MTITFITRRELECWWSQFCPGEGKTALKWHYFNGNNHLQSKIIYGNRKVTINFYPTTNKCWINDQFIEDDIKGYLPKIRSV